MLSASLLDTMLRRLVIVALLSSTAFASKPAKIPCELVDRQLIKCPNREIYASLRVLLYLVQDLPPEILDGTICRFYATHDKDDMPHNWIDWRSSDGKMNTTEIRIKKVGLSDERDN